MESDRVTRLLTLLANLGVIVGIVFLALEMRQTSAIALAEARLTYSAVWRSVDESRQDESFSKVFTKSIVTPEQLSLNEVIRLDGYYTGVLDQLLTAQTFRATGLVDSEFADVANIIGAVYFSNEFARSWWRQVRSDWTLASDSEFQKIMDEAVIAGELGRDQRIYEGIKSDLSQHSKSKFN